MISSDSMSFKYFYNYIKNTRQGKRVFLSLVLGFLIGYFSHIYSLKHAHECVTGFNFIKPTLDCNISEEKAQRLAVLEDKIKVLVDGYKNSKKANRVSVFVRDLQSTKFASVYEGEVFVMASLLKVPLVIAGYKLAEVEPKILEQEFKYKGVPNLYGEQNFKSSSQLEVGRSYSLKEMMSRAIIYSDNTAAQILAEYYAPGFFEKILRALGLSVVLPDGSGETIVTARSYANIFRLLYNASYLTAEYSNEVLELLTKTEYNRGAMKLLPQKIKVAHKFGERAFTQTREGVTVPVVFQLHECGLVYAEDAREPYTFCVLSEGGSFDDLENIQAEISLLIYESIIGGE